MKNVAIIFAYMADTGKQLESSSMFHSQQKREGVRKAGTLFLFLALFLVPLLGQRGNVVAENNENSSLDVVKSDMGPLTHIGKGGLAVPNVIDDAIHPIPYDEIGYSNLSEGEFTEIVDENGIPIRIYEVKPGDTLSEIAEEYAVSTNTIKWENNLKSAKDIHPGQKLRILPTTGILHKIRKGDTLSRIAKRYDVPLDNIRIANDITDDRELIIGNKILVPNGVKKQEKGSSGYKQNAFAIRKTSKSVKNSYYARPSAGTVTSWFGPRRGGFHYGIDYGQYWGAPVVASASGVVERVVSYCRTGSYRCGGGYGNNVLIRHSNGTKTRYTHLKSTLVKVGQRVEQGQKIGTMGNTGNVRPRPKSGNSHAGTHLHFEIVDSRTGRKINPNFLR